MEEVACNLCGADAWQLVKTVPVKRFGPHERFQLVQCRDCGLLFLNPRPSPEEMRDYYPAAYYEDLASIDKTLHRWYQEGKLRKLPTHSKGGRLLDVGCNEGLFLHLARQAGWEVQGTEIAESSAAYAREALEVEVFSGELAEANFPAQHFNVVTFWHVLEHLHNPLHELREAHRILKPNGLLIVEVPNIASWQARLFNVNWRALDVPRHLYHFSPDSLQAMLAQARFTCFKIGYWSRGHNMGDWHEQTLNLASRFVPKPTDKLRSSGTSSQGLPRYLRRALFLSLYYGAFSIERVAALLGQGGILSAFARKGEGANVYASLIQ